MSEHPGFAEVDRLIDEQKFKAALERVEEILGEVRGSSDAATWTRALIRAVQLRMGLHTYEGAVRFLRQEPWPETPLHHAVLELFYAQSLVQYLEAYSWEIRQRERVVSTAEVDLKAWTAEQIYGEAQRAYLAVWEQRGAWGAESIGTLAEHIQQNDYPARIRGSLRDAVTYLWVELLANTSLWKPEHSSELFRLDFEELLAGAPEPDLGDPEVHPLVKIAAVLADLEAWHRGQGRPEAAFEARRERAQRLWGSFSRAEDKEAILGDMTRQLDRLGRRYPWWSMGRATQAELVRQLGDPQALVRARNLAEEGARAHPDSVGGRRCRHIAATIAAPSYELTAMTADGAHRRSIQVQHANLDRLYFRAYRRDLRQAVEGARDYNLLPHYREVEEIVAGRTPAVEWSVDLPPTPDYRQHQTYVTPPMERPGLYVVVASARGDFRPEGNQLVAVNLVLTDLVILGRPEEGATEVTVRSGESGRPVTGVEVTLYRLDWRSGHRRLAARTTGEDGRVSLDLPDPRRERYAVLATLGEDTAVDPGLMRRYRHLEREPRASALLYTDRSVYRPQQEILWKVVAYRGRGEEGRYQALPGQELTVTLVDANGEEVASTQVTTNDYGSASGAFPIPSGRLLGGWHLRTSAGGHAPVRVEEYKRPTFEVEVSDPEAPLRLNRPATLTGEARYYFGLPVAGGDVAWQVTREPVYPRWWGWWGPPPPPPQVVAAGVGEVEDDGGFRITFTPEADEREAASGVTYRYRLTADVTDEGGETRTASRVFRLGFVAVEATLETETTFLRRGEAATVTVRRMDLNGVGRAGEGGWRLVALEQPESTPLPAEVPVPPPPGGEDPVGYRTEGDGLRPRWQTAYRPEALLKQWGDGEEVRHGKLEHGEDGVATLTLEGLAPGPYRLHYSTTDSFGAPYETSTDLIVAAPGATPLALPALLLAESSSVPVGGTARLLIHSGLAEQEMMLEIFRGEERVRSQRLTSAGGTTLLELPAGPEDRGGFGVRLTALRDHQLMTLTSSVFVPWEDRELHVELASFRDRLRPGTRETWRVKVTGPDEAAVASGAAEVLAYMYDRSLDLFAPHQPPRIQGLYPRLTGTPPLDATLGFAGSVWREGRDFVHLPPYPSLRPDRLTFLDGYGIGGLGGRFRQRVVDAPMAMRVGGDRVVAEQELMVTAASPALEEARVSTGLAKAAAEPGAAPPGEDAGAEGAPPEPPAEVRTDFAETAFWEPHLITDEDGAVAFEFQVPDSVTEWNVWVHALTRDLRGGALEEQVRTVKDLLVRPYLPRFLREGDRAEIKVVVNNAGEAPLAGTLRFQILDPETEGSLGETFGLGPGEATASFSVPPGGGSDLTFPVTVPARVGTVAFKVVGRAGGLSDGELRPLPVLPGRVHLAQSRFATLHDADRRVLSFPDLAAAGDPTLLHDQLVITLDAQLFYSVLSALPYLVDYPYDCTEQLLNRFVSTGIVTSLFEDYPAVARMAEELSARETRLERWDEPDPNRRMQLVETPWLVASRGGAAPEGTELIKVLDPRVAAAQRRESLAKLEKAQTSLGAFPWWPGGPPSPYMTLYLLHGLARAREYDVEVPREMVVKAWAYMHRHYVDELARRMLEEDCCWEMVTFLNYVLSSYPEAAWTGDVFSEDDRRQMLEHSFRHWREHSPRLKAYLALTLARAGRTDDARLVFDSVMDSAETTADEGTFWAPEDRAWLWYNDTVESHAFALYTLSLLTPDDARRHGLVQWLLLNKKLNHWKSTRATAEVIWSLVHYLEREGALGVKEEATVTAGPRRQTFTFEPDRYTGKKNQLVIPGAEVEPAMAQVVVEKETPGFLFASATWHFSTERLPEEAEGDLLRVTRRTFKRHSRGGEWVLEPLEDGAVLAPGDQVEVHLSVRARHAAEYVHLRDPRGAGFEPQSLTSGYRFDLGLGYYEEVRDSGTDFFFEWLPAGEYTLKHRLRANLGGTFRVGPATLQSMYAPEFTAYSAGQVLQVAGGGTP